MNAITKANIEFNLKNFHFYSGLNRSSLPAYERAKLEKNSKIIKLGKNSALYSKGETPKGIYIVVNGKIKFTQLNLDGSLQILSIYTPGDIFGYCQILCNDPHFASAIALEDCKILFIEKEHFLNVIKGSRNLSNILLESICHEHVVQTNRINIFAQKSLKERLAYFLLILNEKYKFPAQFRDEDDSVEIRMNRIDLASFVGSSVEPVVRALREFKDKNYIKANTKSIYINDFDSLYSLIGI